MSSTIPLQLLSRPSHTSGPHTMQVPVVSQMPVAPELWVQVLLAGRVPVSRHTGAPLVQVTLATRQGPVGVQDMPSWQGTH